MRTEQIINQGFAAIPGVLSRQEIAAFIEEFEIAYEGRADAGIRNALGIKSVSTLARDPRILNIARHVVGSGAQPFRATFFNKSLQTNWLVAWHQDKTLPLKKRQPAFGWGPWSVKQGTIYAQAPASVLSRILALRIHFEDSVSQNGPLRVLPGTHNLGVLTDGTIQELATRITSTECTVAGGGILAMRPLLIHSSSKSHSNNPRRVLHIEYASSLKVGEGLELASA